VRGCCPHSDCRAGTPLPVLRRPLSRRRRCPRPEAHRWSRRDRAADANRPRCRGRRANSAPEFLIDHAKRSQGFVELTTFFFGPRGPSTQPFAPGLTLPRTARDVAARREVLAKRGLNDRRERWRDFLVRAERFEGSLKLVGDGHGCASHTVGAYHQMVTKVGDAGAIPSGAWPPTRVRPLDDTPNSARWPNRRLFRTLLTPESRDLGRGTPWQRSLIAHAR
jgi:hypothetical protein